MTETQHPYWCLRNEGRSHHAAVRELSRRLGVDEATVGRTLRRAEQEDRHETTRRLREQRAQRRAGARS